MILVTQGVEY